jgi:hypothetical protein
MRKPAFVLAVIVLVALATGAHATTPNGVVISGQVYCNNPDFGSIWNPGWNPMIPSGVAWHIESDPGDWLYAIPLDAGSIRFGLNTVHSGPQSIGAYEGYVTGSASGATFSQFDFNVFAVGNLGMSNRWGSNSLQLELWDVDTMAGHTTFKNLLWSSLGPWDASSQHVSITVPGVYNYAFRLAVVPEPSALAALGAGMPGLLALRKKRTR